LGNLKDSNVHKQWYNDNAKDIFQLKGYDGLGGILASKSRVTNTLVDIVTVYAYALHVENKTEWVPKDAEEFYMKVGYSTNVLFEECSWASQSFNCSEHITEVFDGDYGKCFYIQLNGVKQMVSGSGLSLVLNLDIENAYGTDVDFGVSPPIFDGISLKVCVLCCVFLSQHYCQVLIDEHPLATMAQTPIAPATYTTLSLEATQMSLIDQQRGGQVCQDGDGELKVCCYTKTARQLS
jgi:hypothetical protein